MGSLINYRWEWRTFFAQDIFLDNLPTHPVNGHNSWFLIFSSLCGNTLYVAMQSPKINCFTITFLGNIASVLTAIYKKKIAISYWLIEIQVIQSLIHLIKCYRFLFYTNDHSIAELNYCWHRSEVKHCKCFFTIYLISYTSILSPLCGRSGSSPQ